MSFSFLVPAFLAGLLALAIPVIVHLSRRQTKDPIHFPSLMFLRNVTQKTESRRQIHRWPLFLVRCLAILLLVLAFSRPFVNWTSAAASAPLTGSREVVVLVDRSFSMGAGDRWQRAQQAASEAIDGLRTGDRGTVVLFDSNAEAATESTIDRNVLKSAVQSAEPSTRTTRYAPALRYAARILSSSPLPRHEIVVVSDFQRSGWDADGGEAASLRLPAGTVLTPVPVADTAAVSNVSISGAEFERSTAAGRERVDIVGRLTSSGEVTAPVSVRLEVGGRPVASGIAEFSGGTASVTFPPLTLPIDGDTRATLRVGEDALAVDNEFNFVLSSDQRVGVLIINGPGAEEGSFFIERALAIGDSPGFRAEVRRSNEVRSVDLTSNPVIVLNQASIPAGELGERLRQHVERGGGVVMILGDNSLGQWEGVLPSVGNAVDRSSGGGVAVGYIDTGHPVFETFAGPRNGDFGTARVYRYRPLPNGTFPRVLARYGDGGTALAEAPVGEGRVLVWSSTMDGQWNDLSLQPVFLPFLHQLAKYAAGYTPPRSWLTAGDPFDAAASVRANETYSLAITPSGEQVSLEQGVPLSLDEIGFYELRDPGTAGSSLAFAVNVDPVEANLTPFDPAEMASAVQMAAEGGAVSGGIGELTLADREREQSGWWYLIIAVFLLLIGETLFSNRGAGTAISAAWDRVRNRAGGNGNKSSSGLKAS